MISVPYEKEFVFHDGRRAKSLSELYKIIQTLDEYAFNAFVNTEKNDFANWIEHVLCDYVLAERLRGFQTQTATLELLAQKLSEIVAQESLVRIARKEVTHYTVPTSVSPSYSSQSFSSPSPHSTPLFQPSHAAQSVSSASQTVTAPLPIAPDARMQELSTSSTTHPSLATTSNSTTSPHSILSSSTIPPSRKWYEFFIRKKSSQDALASIQKDATQSTIPSSTTILQSPAAGSSVSASNSTTSPTAPKKLQNKWYEFFIRKKSSQDALHLLKEEVEHAPMTSSPHTSTHTKKRKRTPEEIEELFWTILYTILVITIIGLLSYILFIKKPF